MCPSSHSGGFTIGRQGTRSASRSRCAYSARVRRRASRSASASEAPSYNRSMGSAKPVVCIVTPGTRTANNGNWRTAVRWAEMLRGTCKVIVQTEWEAPASADRCMPCAAPSRPPSTTASRGAIAVMLTADLYRDPVEEKPPAPSSSPTDRDPADEAPTLQRGMARQARVITQSAPIAVVMRLAISRLRRRGHLRVRPRRCSSRSAPSPSASRSGCSTSATRWSRDWERRLARWPKPTRAIATAAPAPTPRSAMRSARRTSSFIPRSWRAAPT